MRLYKTMKQYFLFILLAVWIHSCHGHEHHNHIDPVTAKYSQSANAIDPLSKTLDVNNIPKSDESDDDTIDARLRAKHNLRNSIHQHSSDDESDRNESEEDYIKQLNAPLENDLQFQPVPPPIVETPNHTLGQKQPVEIVQPAIPIQNETISTTVEPKANEPPVTTAAPITIDIVKPIVIETVKPIQQEEEQEKEKPAIKPIVDEVKSILDKHNNAPQQPIDTPQQKIIKDAIPVAPLRETVPITESVTPPTKDIPKQMNERESVSTSTSTTTVQPVIVQEEKQVQEPVPVPVVEPVPTMTTTIAIPVANVVIDQVKPVETVVPEKKIEETLTTTSTPARVLRSTTTRFQQKAQAARQRQLRSKTEPENITEESIPKPVETAEAPEIPVQTPSPTIEVTTTVATPIENIVETTQTPDVPIQTLPPTIEIPSTEDIDFPRQVHVHDTKTLLHAVEEQEQKKESLVEQIENNTTSSSFLSQDHTPHLPRILENDDQPITTTMMTTQADHSINAAESTTITHAHTHSKDEETNKSVTVNATIASSNGSESFVPTKLREVCWTLPKPVHPTLDLVENHMLTVVGFLPEFIQTIFFARLDNPEVVINTLWFMSICVVCFVFSLFFLTMATNRLRQSHDEKAIRTRCQQLQQDYNQLELERATFERQNQKLSDEIDEIKMTPVRDSDEELFELKELYQRLQMENQTLLHERDGFHRELVEKQRLIDRHDNEMHKQIETVAQLNHELLQRKDELEKERRTIVQLQTSDLSLERFEKLQETIHDLKAEITQLKQEKFHLNDQLKDFQEQANQLDIEKNQLTIKMKQLKELVEQRDETITRIREKMSSEREDSNSDFGDILSTVPETRTDENQELLSTIDNDVEKANEHMRQLHHELDEKTRRIKELDHLLNQEKDRCREMETKLKVVLELRERDAHLHIRQLGQTDAELRKARTDTERVRILQQQLDLKQKQLEDVQKEMENDKTKYSEEFSKLQHDTHEKWMEVKRLTRELDAAKKECEALRRQITKYANNERASQEKTMLKPVAHHLNNSGRLSSEPETNGSSPPPPISSYQQNENFRPIDHQRNDSGAASPIEMFGPRPPMFGMPRPPFYPPPFLPPPPNAFMIPPRFPMPMPGPHGMISPIAHLMTNGSAGGSDANSFEIVDSKNITPNSISYDGQTMQPPEDEHQQPITTKPKKTKKKSKTTTATAAPNTSTSMT